MRYFAKLWPLFAVVATWDAVTTVIGTIAILGGTTILRLLFGFLVGLAIAGILFFTFDIWSKHHPVLSEYPIMDIGLKTFWSLSFIYNVSTAFYGNAVALDVGLQNAGEILVLLSATFIVSSSTIVTAFLLYWQRRYGSQEEQIAGA